MSGIPAGAIVHVGGRTVLNRLQDAGMQDPRVPSQVVYETGNDQTVGKILTEAEFRFQLTSWDVSTDLMGLLHGNMSSLGSQLTGADPDGTIYRWEDCQFVNVTSPWKGETGADGGDVVAGVIIPNLYPTALSYRLGVTDNAQMQVTLSSGAYFMSESYPMEESAAGDGATVAFVTSEHARVLRIGGAGSTNYQHVFGVLVDGVVQIPGIDYVETGGATPEAGGGMTAVTITFATAPRNGAVVKFCYFTTTTHAIPQVDNLDTTVTPAAVRGRDIEVLVGDPQASPLKLYGVQSVELNATNTGRLQRQMGTYDPIGYAQTGIDCNGTVNIEPKDIGHLFESMKDTLGIDRSEVVGYINQHTVPVTYVIYDPVDHSIIKSIFIPDATFQAPGENARVQQVTQFPLRFESWTGTFHEVKGRLPTVGE